jgi:diguanylate cyclase (GGDEF)-like protein/PAS domain S-box-containing protein
MNELSELISHLFEGVYIVDQSRKIVFWNSGSERITGFKAEEVMNQHCFNNILQHVDKNGKELCFGGCPLHQTLNTGDILENEVFLHHKEGHRIPVTVKTFPLHDGDGNITAAVEVFTDSRFQESKYKENRELRALLTIDILTTIPNRRYLEFQLESFIKEYNEFQSNFGILFFDIDHFKNINDTYGHNIGDEVLKVVASTLESNVRGKDIIGRWGGEEFIGLFKIDSINNLAYLSKKLRMLIEKSVYQFKDTEAIKVTVSIGGTLYKEGESYSELVQRADELMYNSKQNGRNRSTIK